MAMVGILGPPLRPLVKLTTLLSRAGPPTETTAPHQELVKVLGGTVVVFNQLPDVSAVHGCFLWFTAVWQR